MESRVAAVVFDLVRALGGPAHVARVCGVSATAISNWQVANAVPPRHWLTIWRLAKARGLDWRPPGAEDLDIVPRADMGGDPVAAPRFAQCSRHAAQQTEEAA
jgi:hypothetical protein